MTGLYQQSADVRFREIDLSQSLRNRSSANGAIVLVSKKGRLGRHNTTSWTDFVSEYGERDAAVSFGHYCAHDFFDEGNYLDVVRVAGTGYAHSAVILTDDGANNSTLTPVQNGIRDPDNIDWDEYVLGSVQPVLMFYPAQGPGSYGDNVAIRIVSQNLDVPEAPTLSSTTVGGILAAGTYGYTIAAISAAGDTMASAPATITLAATTTGTVILNWKLVENARGYKIFGRGADATVQGLMATVGANTIFWVDSGAVTPDLIQPPVTDPADAAPPDQEFIVEVYDNLINPSIPQEKWNCTLTDKTDGNGVQLEATQRINPYSLYIKCQSYVPLMTGQLPIISSTSKENMAGGDSGAAPTNGQISLAWVEEFSDAEKVMVNILINAGYTDVGVQKTMLKLAEARGDSTAVLDTPAEMQKYSDAIAYRQLVLNANTSYGAIYTSDVLVNDDFNGKRILIPCSGKVAAVYARTDRVAGPQYAPAGLNRGQVDVLDIRNQYNEPQRTQLFQAQVNYIRSFIGMGTAVFEQVTLQAKQSALSWVAVRRMINVIKGGVKDYLMYSLHEPNDDFLRRQIIGALTDYLNYWKNARGIIDFQVIADDSNNPPAKYNLGILTVTIIITPVIAVHEIGVDMVITKAGVSFSEIDIAALG
jgi:hypothetical protein